MTFNKTWVNISAVILTLLLCYFPLCHRIDIYCIQSWDESRNVINAIEMLGNHHWFVRYFENKPDVWELKPPFLVWCQVLSIKLFGLSELSIRMPSMIFSMSTVLLLIWAAQKISGNMSAGIIASLILVSSQGYIGPHVARFGDHDAVLVFFSTAFICFTYLFFETGQTRYLILMFIALFFGWFAKSIIIFMFLPGLLIWAIANQKLKNTVIRKGFWIGIIIVLSLIISYYLFRENYTPGYIQEVWMNEWFGRYFDASPNYHYSKDSFWYYWKGFINGRLWPFIIAFLVGCIPVVFRRNLPNRHFLLFLLLNSIIFFLILSAGTKNYWYDAPLYPIVALFLGILAVQLYKTYNNKGYRMACVFLGLIIISPSYTQSVQNTLKHDPYESYPLQSLCYYLKDDNHKLPGQFKILYSETDQSPLYFYIEKAKEKYSIAKLSKLKDLKVNDTVLIHENYKKDSLEINFSSELITADKGCEIRRLLAQK